MSELGVAYVSVLPSMKGFNKSLEANLGGVNASGIGGKVGTSFNRGFSVATVALGNLVGGAISKAVGAVSSSIGSAIARVDTINNFPKIMQSMGYSADDARLCVDKLSNAIDGLPTSLDGMVSATQKIAPFAGSLDNAAQISIALNNALIAGGKSTQIQANALEQYSQMLALGKVDMQAWRSMATAMGGQLDQLSVKLLGAGHNQMDLYKAMQNGTVTFDDFNNALVELNQNGIEGFASLEEQARSMSGGIQTALDNVQNRVNKAIASIIDEIGQENISGLINSFSSQFANLAKPVVNFVHEFKEAFDFEGVAAAFAPVADALSGIIPALQAYGSVMGTVVGTNLSNFLKWTSEVGTMLSDVLRPGFEALAPTLQSLASAFEPLVSAISEFASGHGEAFDGMMQRIGEHMQDVGPAMDYLNQSIGELATALEPVVNAIAPLIVDYIGQFISGLAALIPIAINGIAFIIDGVGGLIEFVTEFVNLVASIPGKVAEFFYSVNRAGEDALNSLGTAVSNGFTAIRTAASNLTSAVTGFFVRMGSTISTTVSNAFNFIRTAASNVVSSIGSFFSSLPGRIAGVASSIYSSVTGAFNSIISFVSSIPSRIVSFFYGLGSRITSAIGSIHFPTPHIDGSIDLFGIKVPSIRWYAQGGFVDGAQIIGAGENGAEMILPKSGAMMQEFARAIESEMSSGTYATLQQILRFLEGGGLGETIADYAPTATAREIRRMNAKVNSYA